MSCRAVELLQAHPSGRHGEEIGVQPCPEHADDLRCRRDPDDTVIGDVVEPAPVVERGVGKPAAGGLHDPADLAQAASPGREEGALRARLTPTTTAT